MKVADFENIRKFLKENSVTLEDMDTMWAFMYDKNPIVTNLTDHDQNWSGLNRMAMKSLIDLYTKAQREMKEEE